MVRTMEISSVLTSPVAASGLENGRSTPDSLTSDFSIISHATIDPEQPVVLQGQNLEHLNHLQFSGINQQLGLETSFILTSTEEVQQQLRDIVKENVELKDALQQNNITLRQHFSTIVNWQEQCNKARIRQKEVVENMRVFTESLQDDKKKQLIELEAKQQTIVSLSEENEKALLEIQNKEKLLKEAEVENGTLTPELKRQQVLSMHLEEALKEAQSDIKSLQDEKSVLLAQLRSHSEKQRNPIPKYQSPILVTEEDSDFAVIHHGPTSYANDELALLRQTVDGMKEEKTLFSRLLAEGQEEIKYLKAELASSNEELKEVKKKEQSSSSWVASLASVAAPPDKVDEEIVRQSLTAVQGANSELMKCQNRFTSLNDQLEQCQERLEASMHASVTVPRDVEKLWDEICLLRTIVKEEQETKESYRYKLEECQTQFHNEYQVLMKQWENYQSDVKSQGRQLEALSEIENRKNQECLDGLTARMLHLEETLQEKEREIDRMKKQILMMEREAEQIPILRSRNELFVIELHKAKEEKNEKNSLLDTQKKEIYSLQTQVVQLMDEVNQVSHQQLAEMSAPSKPSHRGKGSRSKLLETLVNESLSPKQPKCPVHKTSNVSNRNSFERSGELLEASGTSYQPKPSSWNSEEKDPYKMFQCPRCFLPFKDVRALTNHVETCLENDNNPFL